MSHNVSALACTLQLKVKITKQQAAKEQKQRRKNLIKYVPNAAAAVYKVLRTMSETAPVLSSTPRTLCSAPPANMQASGLLAATLHELYSSVNSLCRISLLVRGSVKVFQGVNT